jgi:hypothetical protein
MDNLFAGSPRALIAQLVSEHGISAEELQTLARDLKTKPGGDR